MIWTGRKKDLAAAVGIHPVTLSAWLRGAYLPPKTKRPLIARALGVELSVVEDAIAASEQAAAEREQQGVSGTGACPDSAGEVVP